MTEYRLIQEVVTPGETIDLPDGHILVDTAVLTSTTAPYDVRISYLAPVDG